MGGSAMKRWSTVLREKQETNELLRERRSIDPPPPSHEGPIGDPEESQAAEAKNGTVVNLSRKKQ